MNSFADSQIKEADRLQASMYHEEIAERKIKAYKYLYISLGFLSIN